MLRLQQSQDLAAGGEGGAGSAARGRRGAERAWNQPRALPAPSFLSPPCPPHDFRLEAEGPKVWLALLEAQRAKLTYRTFLDFPLHREPEPSTDLGARPKEEGLSGRPRQAHQAQPLRARW